jgi:divalent metal cation (Fe/Co/Zn/Cd) transporter
LALVLASPTNAWAHTKVGRIQPVRMQALHLAIRLEIVTIIWMVLEAAGAIAAGLFARSLLLMAFGIDSVIELFSAILLFWRLRKESTGALDILQSEAVEQKASRISGWLLYILAFYVVIQAAYCLLQKTAAEKSLLGISIAVIAAFGMPALAKRKLRLAAQIESSALRADAIETLTCGYFAIVLLIGLLLNAVFHWWWLDSIASLAFVPLLLKEGNEAVTGKCCSEE